MYCFSLSRCFFYSYHMIPDINRLSLTHMVYLSVIFSYGQILSLVYLDEKLIDVECLSIFQTWFFAFFIFSCYTITIAVVSYIGFLSNKSLTVICLLNIDEGKQDEKTKGRLTIGRRSWYDNIFYRFCSLFLSFCICLAPFCVDVRV